MSTVYEYITKAQTNNRHLFFLLIDPGDAETNAVSDLVAAATENGVDGFLVGGSLVTREKVAESVQLVKKSTDRPVVLFPGAAQHVVPEADAILFLSLLSGRNPDYLIGQHIQAAPVIRDYDLEAIPTAYLLVESGGMTSVEFISATRPLPRNNMDIAVAHALAARYLGMKLVYLEAGSGARMPVPDEMIEAVAQQCHLPLIVGGGLTGVREAAAKARAGATVVVAGNHFEQKRALKELRDFADSIHAVGH
ncbi:MAG: geranylgeranylglyceryl/heptaprenylglyceryl phosphate synthase [Chlorobi bacterium]|nr:geranylgeranylglyceryl/heptaprenylglyceryl phosphate synthase [Chlorobiota bacterium]